MHTRITIRENATGTERQVTLDIGDDPGAIEFQLFEGNYSCDCNRELLFRRAGGEKDPIETHGCGSSRFGITKHELAP